MVRARCHRLACQAHEQLVELTGLPPLYPPSFFAQMFAVALPPEVDPALQARLLAEDAVEVPVTRWDGQALVRVSVQGYNDEADIAALLAGVERILGENRQR